MEQSKARSLADALTHAEFSSQITAQDSLFRILNELKRQLFSTQDLINKELLGSSDSEKLSELRENVVQLDRKIQACKLTIEEKHPGYFKVKYGYQNPSISEVQDVLRTKKQVLIEFFWGHEFVYAIGIGSDQVLFRKIGSVDSIAPVVDSFLSHLHGEQSTMTFEAFDLYSDNAFKLYKILVDPFAALLRNKNRLQIIPDGMISQLPFEILIDEQPDLRQVNYLALKYLIKSYAIGYAYSSSMLIDQDRVQAISDPTMLAVGFKGGNRSDSATLELKDIEGTQQELNALKTRFQNGRFLTEDRATEFNFKSMAPDLNYHLAVHGRGDVKKILRPVCILQIH